MIIGEKGFESVKVVIIIPTYNEKGNIERLITRLEEDIFPKIKRDSMNILVADDTSPDGTADVVRGLMKKYQNIGLVSGPKHGLGAAYIRAMEHATRKLEADIMFEMDADLSHDPEKIPEFLDKIDEGYDLVVGARYIKGGGIPRNWGIHRKAFSIFGNLIVRVVLGRFWHHDWTTGYRAVRADVFQELQPELTAFRGYTFQVSFLHKAMQHGFKVTEVPFNFVDRTLGKSKIAPREYIFDLLAYIFIARFIEILRSPFPKYVVTGLTGYVINAVGLEMFKNIFGLHSGVAGALGAEIAIIWNFTLNNFWSFRKYQITEVKKIPVKFIEYNLVSLGSVVIIGSVITVGITLFGDTRFVRQLFLVIALGLFVIPYSYTMYNLFIWKRWRPRFLQKIQELVG